MTMNKQTLSKKAKINATLALLTLTLVSSIPSNAQSAEAPLLKGKSPSIFELKSSWKTDDGRTVKLESFKGQKLVIAMLYTSCQTACPLILKKLKSIDAALIEKKISSKIVAVTFDTETDSAEKLAHFKEHLKLDPTRWTFLAGSANDTRQLSMVLGIKYNKNTKSGEIMHDNKITLVDESGAIVRTIEGLDAGIAELF